MSNYEIEQKIRKEIAAGEKLLWHGRPRRGLMLRPSDAFLIPFSLIWCGFSVLWEAVVIASAAPLFFKLWGLPFLFLGVYLLVGRFFVDEQQRGRTIYAVTNKRVIIVSGLMKDTVTSLDLRALANISLSEKPDGTGTIFLGRRSAIAPDDERRRGRSSPRILEGISNARSVYETLLEAQRNAMA